MDHIFIRQICRTVISSTVFYRTINFWNTYFSKRRLLAGNILHTGTIHVFVRRYFLSRSRLECSILQKDTNKILTRHNRTSIISFSLFQNSFHQNVNNIQKILHLVVIFQFTLYFVSISYEVPCSTFRRVLNVTNYYFFQNGLCIQMLNI